MARNWIGIEEDVDVINEEIEEALEELDDSPMTLQWTTMMTKCWPQQKKPPQFRIRRQWKSCLPCKTTADSKKWKTTFLRWSSCSTASYVTCVLSDLQVHPHVYDSSNCYPRKRRLTKLIKPKCSCYFYTPKYSFSIHSVQIEAISR